MKAAIAQIRAQLRTLTDDEAITLRRVAFGESEIHLLRTADLKRLQELGFIVAAGNSMTLTNRGKAHCNLLPRATFAASIP